MEGFYLNIQNKEKLVGNSSLSIYFDKDGGSVGFGDDNKWQIQDVDNDIAERHFMISFVEETFVLLPMGKSDVFINDSFSKLPYGHSVALSFGDRIRIGALEMLVSNEETKEIFSQQNILGELAQHNAVENVVLANTSSDLKLEQNNINDIIAPAQLDINEMLLGHQKHDNVSMTYLKSYIKNVLQKHNRYISHSFEKHISVSESEFENLLNQGYLSKNTQILNTLILAIVLQESRSGFMNIYGEIYQCEHILAFLQPENAEVLESLLIEFIIRHINFGDEDK